MEGERGIKEEIYHAGLPTPHDLTVYDTRETSIVFNSSGSCQLIGLFECIIYMTVITKEQYAAFHFPSIAAWSVEINIAGIRLFHHYIQ